MTVAGWSARRLRAEATFGEVVVTMTITSPPRDVLIQTGLTGQVNSPAQPPAQPQNQAYSWAGVSTLTADGTTETFGTGWTPRTVFFKRDMTSVTFYLLAGGSWASSKADVSYWV